MASLDRHSRLYAGACPRDLLRSPSAADKLQLSWRSVAAHIFPAAEPSAHARTHVEIIATARYTPRGRSRCRRRPASRGLAAEDRLYGPVHLRRLHLRASAKQTAPQEIAKIARKRTSCAVAARSSEKGVRAAGEKNH